MYNVQRILTMGSHDNELVNAMIIKQKNQTSDYHIIYANINPTLLIPFVSYDTWKSQS